MLVVRQVYVVAGCQEFVELLFRGVLGVDLLDGDLLRRRGAEHVVGVTSWRFRELAFSIVTVVRHREFELIK